MKETAYFDYNATAPLRKSARAIWLESNEMHWANPSSPYSMAARVKNALEGERVKMGELLGVEAARIVFTSGATEGNNWVISSLARLEPEMKHWYGATEHPSVIEASQYYFGKRSEAIPVNGNGTVELEWMEERLKRGERVAMISIMGANNETGIVQPVEAIERMVRAYGLRWHCDLVQTLGKGPLEGLAGMNFVVGSGHKIGGPKGVGFVVLESRQSGLKGFLGGQQEQGIRAGTENLGSVQAMRVALEEALGEDYEGTARGKAGFEARMKAMGAQVVGEVGTRLKQTTMLIMPQFGNARWIGRLDKKGFYVSSGSACATGKEGASHVLTAMGLSATESGRAIRVSGSSDYGEEAWGQLAGAIERVYVELSGEETRQEEGAVIIIP